jgi:hypothetical protein
MFTLFVDDLAFEMKLDVRERLPYHTHEIQPNEQRPTHNTTKAKVKSDLDKSIAHFS